MNTSERLEKAILAINKLNKKIDNLSEPIAIIGLSCTFPGAKNANEFWQLLQEGKDAISEIPASRWDVNTYYDADPDAPGKMIMRKAGLIEDIDTFDANFFAISPREAQYLDPQQRLLLEQTWHALEDANIAPSSLKETKTGVFIGISTRDYYDLLNHYGAPEDINAYFSTGNAFSTAAGRISYTLGLQGPNMAIETACSSSLVALHEACNSLQRGESNLALVGGVNALLAPELFISFSNAHMLAPDGHCKTFDAKADGYVRGEGCGMVVLKRLSEALRDKDRVLAVIKASGVNQSGASGGLTVPNGEAQASLLQSVLAEAKLNPADVDYVECHGTGTSLGDPIEVHALGDVYGRGRDKETPLHLSAVKSNIGHLEAAAGVAGLIKAVLALQHKTIPKTLHFQQLNPHIELNFPAEIVTQTKPWLSQNKVRHAAVSSFGFSGTNAHVILEEAPTVEMASEEAGDWVVCLSAKTPTALEQMIKDYSAYLEAKPQVSIQDLVYTANTGRSRFEFQAHFKATTVAHLFENLKTRTTTNNPEYTPKHGNKITLPTYPFEKQRYWLEIINTARSATDETQYIIAPMKPKRSLSKTFLVTVVSKANLVDEEQLQGKDYVTLVVGKEDVLEQFKQVLMAIVLQKNQQIYCALDVTVNGVDSLVNALIQSGLPVSTVCLLAPVSADNKQIKACLPLYQATQKQLGQAAVYLLSSDFSDKDKKISLKWLMATQKLLFEPSVVIETEKQYQALSWQGAGVQDIQKKTGAPVIALDALDKLKNVSPEEQRIGVLHFLQALLSKVSGHPIENLPTDKGFFELGLDSIMSVELKNKVQLALGKDIKLADTATFEYPSIDALAGHLCALKFGTKAVVAEQKTSFVAQDKIAVVGMACRFPDAPTLDAFWELLNEGRDAIHEVPASRWNVDAYYDVDDSLLNKMYTRKGGFISDVEQFDTAFFGISPREAQYTDPQQRLLLETSWLALEHANATSHLKESNTGVFIGIMGSDYQQRLFALGQQENLQAFGVTNGFYAVSGRISYVLGLQGPSESIDTACSSSLVAVANACRSLQAGDCDMALAGGVNLLLNPETTIQICQAKMLSPEGHCKTFDESANGYARGEGCGVVVLKRLSDALQAGDNILAVIAGSAVNHCGTGSGFTVPNGLAQEKVFKKALQQAHIKPEEVSYIECHGTGTSLGDPIEVGSIQRTYGVGREKNNPVYLGAVKSSIGHLEGAAGIASLIKTVLCLQHKRIVQTLHHKKTNPKIHLDEFNGVIVDTAVDWVGDKRIAAISSFGATGTNAHMLVEEGPEIKAVDAEEGDWVLCLSAKTSTALEQLIHDYVVYLQAHPTVRMQDLVYTVNTCRARLDCQACFAAKTAEQLLESLKSKATTNGAECTPKHGNKIVLPDYPFEKQRYWLESALQEPGQLAQIASDAHPFMLRHMAFPEEDTYIFESEVSASWPEFMPDHTVYGKPVVAGAVWLSVMVSVIERLHEAKQGRLHTIEFLQPAALEPDAKDSRSIRIHVREDRFSMSSFKEVKDAHVVHVQGQYTLEPLVLPTMTQSLESIKARCPTLYKGQEQVRDAHNLSLHLGPHFSWIEEVYYNEHELLAKMRLADKEESMRYLLHPGLIDACFQALFAWMGKDATVLSIPVAIKSFSYDVGTSKPEYVYIRLPEGFSPGKDGLPAIDMYLLDKNGQVLGFIEGFEMQAVSEATLLHLLSRQNKDSDYLYVEHWERQPIAPVLMESMPTSQAFVLLANPTGSPLSAFVKQVLTEYKAKVEIANSVDAYNDLLQGSYSDVFFMFFDKETQQHEQDVPKAYSQYLRYLFDMTKALLSHTWETPPRLWIVGAGLHAVVAHDIVQLSLGGISGFYKTLVQEHPEFKARLIDFELCNDEEEALLQARRLVLRWAHVVVHPDDRETLCAYREDECYVARLMHKEEQQQLEHYRAIPKEPYCLTFESGSITSIHFTPYSKPDTLAAEDVEVSIEAAALNFRDVLNVQGLYPGDAGAVGGDCCGVVTGIGKKVKHLRVGDRVMGMSVGTLASHAIGPADWLVRCPEFLDSAKASTLPSVFCTSYIALVELAQLKANEVVLIHGASGGVGLAAIQIAKHLGATVIATAGSARKRSYLKHLGIDKVFDSRSFSYVDSMKGQCVDVVLNFLVGDFIEQTLKITKKNGRFIEIGKRDIYSKEQMHKARPDIEYHIYALDEMLHAQPKKIAASLEVLVAGLKKGIYSALPATQFPFTRVVSAFNYLGRTKHIGKVVLIPPKAVWPVIHPDVPILIIGGLGGIGYTLAQWCLEQGAKHLLLSGRKALNKEMQTQLDALGQGVRYIQLDVADAKALKALIQQTPLQAICNIAGVLEDATLDALTWEAVQQVSLPKVDGSWNLYQALCASEQERVPIISFSSIASLLGSGGQAHYAAANSFINTFSTWCRQRHMLSQSIAWGPWADVGMAKDLVVRHARSGMVAIKPQMGMKLLKELVQTADEPATVMVAKVHWNKLPLLAQTTFLDKVAPKAQVSSGDLLAYLQKLAPEKQHEALQDRVAELVAEVMGMSSSSITNDKGFFDLGMDSLMAVELKNRLQTQIGQDKPLHSTLIFDHPNVAKLTDKLAVIMGITNPSKHDVAEKDLDTVRALKNTDIDDLINKALE